MNQNFSNMCSLAQRFNHVPVGFPGYVQHKPHGHIPRVLQHDRFSTEKIPKTRSSEMRVVDGINLDFGIWVTEMKFLVDFVILLDKSGSLDKNIFLQSVNFVLNCDP